MAALPYNKLLRLKDFANLSSINNYFYALLFRFHSDLHLERSERNDSLSMKSSILIVYYSHSGNTEKIANFIGRQTGGDMLPIQPEEAYPISYNAVVEQAKKEIQAGYHPAVKTRIPNLDVYDTIFVGSPNWWSTIAPPVATFLSQNDLSGKNIAPFCTHGGGGLGKVAKDIAKLCPGSTILDSFEIYGDGGGAAQAKLSAWLEKIKVTK